MNAANSWIAAVSEYAVYVDDSGHPSSQPFVVAAGFLATEQQWLSFEPKWLATLNKHGLGNVFHMTDFERQYRNNPQKWPILHELIDIIEQHTQSHFVNIVDMAAYKNVNKVYPLQECIGTPYSMVARGIARQVNIWKQHFFKPGDKALIFVEDGTLHRGDMQEVFRRDDLPIPQPVPKSMPAVQPADWLAWEALYAHRRNYIRKTLARIVRNARDWQSGIWREKDLMRSCALVKLPKRSDIAGMEIVFHSTPKRTRKRTIE